MKYRIGKLLKLQIILRVNLFWGIDKNIKNFHNCTFFINIANPFGCAVVIFGKIDENTATYLKRKFES